MREVACEVAVVGAGTAGLAAYRAARGAGARAVLIEQGPGGTTCARVGCMPSKVLITAATAAHDARDAGTFGVRVEGISVDGRAVMERVRRLRDRFVGSVLEGVDELPREDRIEGRARFTGPGTLVVGGHTRVAFGAAVIATGSSPSVPEPLEGLGTRVQTTDTLFEIDDLPRSLAVLGGGPVGLELAQAMAWLDVETALFDPSGKLGGLNDPDLVAQAHDVFGAQFRLEAGARVERAEADGKDVRLHWSVEDGPGGSASFARVLAAAGRTPNLKGLGLDATGLRLDDKGMPAFDPRTMACEGGPFFLVGDANQARPVVHDAARQGGIAGRNAAALARAEGREGTGGADREGPEPWPAFGLVFTDPQIAVLGPGYDPEAADRVTGRADLSDQGRARVMGRNQGALRVYADRTGRLVGAEMLGPEIEHLAHILAFAIVDGHTAQSLRDRPFYHPTLEQGLETALSDIVSQLG